MHKKGAGNDKQGKDAGNLKLCPYRNFSQAINDHFDYFHEKTSTCIESHVPRKRVIKGKLKLRTKPWINGEIQRPMTHRDKLFKEMINHPTPSNKYLFPKFRNHVVSEKHKGKIKYFQNCFEKHIKTNMKMLGLLSTIKYKYQNTIFKHFIFTR